MHGGANSQETGQSRTSAIFLQRDLASFLMGGDGLEPPTPCL